MDCTRYLAHSDDVFAVGFLTLSVITGTVF
jgi:hypothetical protein